MTPDGQRVKIVITNKINTLQSIMDEEHMNVLNGNVSYKSWRRTNARLLNQYRRFVRSAIRLKNSEPKFTVEIEEFINFCKTEKYLAKSRVDVVRKIMSKRLEYKE